MSAPRRANLSSYCKLPKGAAGPPTEACPLGRDCCRLSRGGPQSRAGGRSPLCHLLGAPWPEWIPHPSATLPHPGTKCGMATHGHNLKLHSHLPPPHLDGAQVTEPRSQGHILAPVLVGGWEGRTPTTEATSQTPLQEKKPGTLAEAPGHRELVGGAILSPRAPPARLTD